MLAYVAALYDEVSRVVRAGPFQSVRAPEGILAWQTQGVRPESAQPAGSVLLAITGWGAEAAATGAGWLVHELRPSAIVAVGYSGGTRPDLRPGSLVIGEQIARLGEQASGAPIPSDRGLVGLAHSSSQEIGIPVAAGLVGTTTHIVSSARKKTALGVNTGVLAVDLETWHFAQASADGGIPFLAVRAIVDAVDDDLPGFVERMAPGPRPPAAIPALRYLLGRPGGLTRVIQTGIAAGHARRALAQFVSAFSARWLASPLATAGRRAT
jgi:nucleoside phosphorylase